MTKQYNVPIKVLDDSKEWMIQTALQPYRVFSDEHGNLDRTCFSRENFPYVGEFIVVKTLKKEAAEKAYEILKGIEGLLVLQIGESVWEEDKKRVARVNRKGVARVRLKGDGVGVG